jgi:SAM-dependent methyltransferase
MTLLWRSLRRTVPFAKGRLIDVGSHDRPYFAIFAPVVSSFISMDLYNPIFKGRSVDVYSQAEYLPVRDTSVDTILCTAVLYLLPEPKNVLLEFKRVLKQGGHIIITTPFMWRQNIISAESNYNDYYRFTESCLVYLGESSGLRVVQLEKRGGFWAVIGEMFSLYLSSTFGRGILLYCLISIIVLPIQALALLLDSVHSGYGETLGFTIVYEKP